MAITTVPAGSNTTISVTSRTSLTVTCPNSSMAIVECPVGTRIGVFAGTRSFSIPPMSSFKISADATDVYFETDDTVSENKIVQIGSLNSPVYCDASTLENILFCCLIPKLESKDRLECNVQYSFTASTNNKTISCRFGNSGISSALLGATSTAAASNSVFSGIFAITNQDSTNSQFGSSPGFVFASGSNYTSNVETKDGGVYVYITGKKGLAGETLGLMSASLKLVKAF